MKSKPHTAKPRLPDPGCRPKSTHLEGETSFSGDAYDGHLGGLVLCPVVPGVASLYKFISAHQHVSVYLKRERETQREKRQRKREREIDLLPLRATLRSPTCTPLGNLYCSWKPQGQTDRLQLGLKSHVSFLWPRR